MNYEKIVRGIRQRIFNYYDESEEKGQKATRILIRAKAKMLQNRTKTPLKVDQWGATAADRRMLARHGMAWGD